MKEMYIEDFNLRLRPRFEWPVGKQQFVVNTEELATFFHFPEEALVSVPKLSWQKFKTVKAPANISKEGTFLGYNSCRGERVPIYIEREDRRRHFYIIGQTGVGKSVYMANMFLQDVANGEGACYMDPHGETVEEILGKIPDNRKDDVIYWNPGDTEFPVGFNIMDVEGIERKNIIINAFISLLYKLYDPNRTGIMGPMLERTVRNVMLTAMEEKGNTLVEALRLLTNPDFAKSKIPLIRDPIIKSYWTEEMARTTDFHKSETLGYYVSKFDRFVSDVVIRNIIGQSQSSIDFYKIMNEKKILLINLSKGVIGQENMSFLGMILIPHMLVASMRRAEMPEEERSDFYLYVDEFQNFATSDFVDILSEARKYRLNLTVGNQYISQIREDVRNAVFGNVGTVGAFRVGVDDASYLVNIFEPKINEFDLINNGIGNMYIKLLVKGVPSEPFSVALDWKEVTSVPYREDVARYIVDRCRRQYARPKAEIENEIIRRAELFSSPTPGDEAKEDGVLNLGN